MLALLIVLQVIVAVFLVLVVLLQPGNKGGMSAALGGAGGETVFGGRGANTFLSKLTFGAAAIFMITSVTLSFKSMPDESIVVKTLKEQAGAEPAPKAATPTIPPKPAAPQAPAPAAPAPTAPAAAPAPAENPAPASNEPKGPEAPAKK